ncbi:hypothetical protein BC941DRAFT_500290 [Chlamydoabsidia padenii]|nr:hypothetical protein BC941DRAFT_500290 [Chlamydoabsidia padenii]
MASSRNPKGAVLDQRHYESTEIVSRFEPIRDHLLTDLQTIGGGDSTITTLDLSVFLWQLQQFQQDHLGVLGNNFSDNINTNLPLRIPAKLFKLDQHHKTEALTDDSKKKKPKKKKQQQQQIPLDKTHPIYTILLSAYSFRFKNNWKQWDLNNTTRKAKIMELIQLIRDSLTENGFITTPRIAFGGSVPSLAKKKLATIVRRIGGDLVDMRADPTHILHGPLHEYEDMEEDWFRTLEKQGDKVLVHWWYYPDSYDSWLTQTEQFADPEDAPEHTTPWNLTCRWLQDTIKFNELMNEEDYEDVDSEYMDFGGGIGGDIEGEEVAEEDDEDEDEGNNNNNNNNDDEDEDDEDEEDEEDDDMDTSVKPGHSKSYNHHPTTTNKALSTTTSVRLPTKRKASEASTDLQHTQNYDFDDGSMNDREDDDSSHSMQLPLLDPFAQPLVRIRDVEVERPLLGSRQRKNEFEPYMNGDISNISQYTHGNIQLGESISGTTGNDDENDLSSLCHALPQDYSSIFVPDWFDMNKVDDIEKLALPEFFDDHIEEYIKYRNFMVKQYQSNPSTYVTVSSCKAAFPEADLVPLVRLHGFLELYNVINGQTDPRRRIYLPVIDGEPDAYPELTPERSSETIEKIDIQYLRKLMYDPVKSRKTCNSWEMKTEESSSLNDGTKLFRCKNCHLDCTALRYQCLKRLDLCLCVDCFVQGKFTSAFSSNDFLRVDETNDSNNNNSIDQDVDEEWTDEETLLLLEGVDRYDDDWLMVSEHVGSRTKEQCITQFLQMPITDEFLTSKLSNKESDQLPFENTANPVMTLVAYLSAHINPGVASAAAKVALKELLSSQAMASSSRRESSGVSDQQIKEGDDQDTTMDVDIDIDQEDEQDEEDNSTDAAPSPLFTKKTTQAAISAAIKAAATQARKLSHYEDQEIQHWTRLAVKTVTDKLSMKIQQYEEFDRILEADNQEMQNQLEMVQTSLESLRKQHFELPAPSTTNSTSAETTTSTPMHVSSSSSITNN